MKVKYMGSADVRLIEAGEDFGGRLATPLEETLRWDRDNNWVVDTDEAGLSEEAVNLLLEDGSGFQDVTGLDRVPVNQHQSIFLGLRDENAETDVRDEVVRAAVAATPPNAGRIAPPEDQETPR